MSIFKACDIRGLVGTEWGPDEARRIGRSLGEMTRRRRHPRMWVGGDFRRSTPILKAALIQGLTEVGVYVEDAGQVPTPVVYFAAGRSGTRSMAIVTGSHNPGPYNGIKFIVGGEPAVPALIDELREGIEVSRPSRFPSQSRTADVMPQYEAWVGRRARRAIANPHPRPGDPLIDGPMVPRKLVLDTMGGAFTNTAARVLGKLGHTVTELSKQIDPDFSQRSPNPAVDDNLSNLTTRVQDESADLGIALDGDGDRVIFVDHLGRIVRPEQIAAALVHFRFHVCTIVYDLKCASIVPRTVAVEGGRAIMQPSGHGMIRSKMLAEDAELGVEVSGHHFFGVLGGGDDGLFTACALLQLMEQTDKTLAELVAPFEWPVITPDIRLPAPADVDKCLESIAAACGGTLTRLDGVRADYDDGGWGLARASITEPAVTFRFEGRDRRHLQAVATRFLAGTPTMKKQVLEQIQ